MKQIDNCFDRFFEGKKPLKQKWRLFNPYPNQLHLYHYHHEVLVYDLSKHAIIREWWDKPADKRGLDAAKEYLSHKFNY